MHRFTILKKAGTAVLLFSLLCLTICGTGSAFAQTAGGFSVSAVIPENQVDTRQTYFDLRMKPGDEQKIEIVITNSNENELTADIRLNAASTGQNGVVVYTEPNVRADILKLSITDIAELETQSVTVPPLSSRTVGIHIKMPDEPFDGILLGGISVTGSDATGEAAGTQGVSLKNTISYVIALKLTENDEDISPDFDLAAITPSLVNYRTAVVATLSNKAARLAKGMAVKAQVYNKGSNTVLHELTLTSAEMAPLSKGDFVVDWNGEPLRPGIYRLKMSADYNGDHWEWDEEFEIAGEAGEINKDALWLTKDYTYLYVLSGLVLLALVFLIAYKLGRRKRPQEG